ncbi:MAG: very short patch repair endonuclease [Prevotella sp.]|jgi:DNA mismatch endonuclease (patch repair protein)|nr:very short patch repair endonuclease [Prevotella sp.]
MDVLTPEQRHKCMSRIHSSDTKPEIFFRKALWKWGIRYRKNVKSLLGTPDIAIKKYKIVIFIDGDFWHGNDWEKRRYSSQEELLSTYSDFWQKKIRRNVERDKKVKEYYKNNGWTILRFFTSETNKNLNECIIKTVETINQLKNNFDKSH